MSSCCCKARTKATDSKKGNRAIQADKPSKIRDDVILRHWRRGASPIFVNWRRKLAPAGAEESCRDAELRRLDDSVETSQRHVPALFP
jgi:hypothetical protein